MIRIAVAFLVALSGCVSAPVDDGPPIVNLAGRNPELFAVELKACEDGADRMATYKPPAGAIVVGISTSESRNSMIKRCLRNYQYRVTN